MSFLSTRRNMLRQRGRPMTLNRLTGSMASGGSITTASITLQGFLSLYAPQEVTGDVRSGDAQVSILNDELATAGWGTPQARDQMIIDGKTWLVQGSSPLWDGTTCVGHTVWVRGGAG